jgi:hypothetical protein
VHPEIEPYQHSLQEDLERPGPRGQDDQGFEGRLAPRGDAREGKYVAVTPKQKEMGIVCGQATSPVDVM